jgi:GT2 family glycosyltransferase
VVALHKIPWVSFGRRETWTEFEQKCAEQRERHVCFARKPHFTLLVNATHLTQLEDLLWTLKALELQTYPHWNAYVWVDESLKQEAPLLDTRIALFHSAELQFGEMLNKARFLPKSDWSMVFQGGDILSPAALFQFVWEINSFPGPELLYPQEAVVNLRGGTPQLNLISKCKDSAPTLLHFNYIGRCFAFHSDLWDRMVASGEGAIYSSEYSWLRKARSLSSEFGLVPGYWYYRNAEFAEPIFEVNPEPVLPLRGEAGKELESEKITAIICFRDKPEMTVRCLKKLLASRGALPLEVLLVDNGSSLASRDSIQNEVARLPEHETISVLSFPEPFNFGRMNNWAVSRYASGSLLLFLNNDVELDARVSLDTWARWALEKDIGTVGICLRFPDGSIQHCGIRASFGDKSHLVRVGNSHHEDALTFLAHEVFANTFAACMIRRSVFDSVGGLRSADMANGFGDVALSLTLKKQGLKNFYLGYFQGTHAEGASRGRSYEYWEEVGLEREFSDILGQMVREDLNWSPVPLAESSLASAVSDALKAQVRSWSWLDPVKPTLKKIAHRVLPGQAHLPI